MTLSLFFAITVTPAEIQILPGQTRFEFGGGRRNISVQFRNASSNSVSTARLRYRLYQSSSGASVPLEPAVDWKTLSIGPSQMLMDEVMCNLPTVRASSTFHLVWSDGDRKLGSTAIQVFPLELLQPLASMAPIGLVDPSGQFTNALTSVGFQSLTEAEEISAFDGKLILVAPMSGSTTIAGLAGALKRRAVAGIGVVWIQSLRPAGLSSISSAYVVNQEEGRIVIAQESLVAELSSSPLSQLRLIELSDLALGRRKLGLPGESQPASLTQDESTNK